MKRMLASMIVAGLALAAFSTSSFAGANRDAKIVLHVLPKVQKNDCGPVANPPCQGMIVNGALYPVTNYVYVVVADANATAGIAGLQLGISYSGGVNPLGGNTPINVYKWVLCATLEFSSGGWPAPGSGNLITWDATAKCQRTEPGGPGTGVVAAAGYFYMAAYAPSTMSVTPRPVDSQLKVADCASVEDLIGGSGAVGIGASHAGQCSFGQPGAYNPCGTITPVQSTTWGSIKSTFSN